MNRRSLTALVAATVTAVGCETFTAGKPAEEAVAPAAPPSTAVEETLLFGAINEPRLPSGECGMVLWTLDERSPKAIFRYVVGSSAQAVVGGAETEFALVDVGGGARFGVPARQSFISSDGKRADVRVAFGLGFDGGVYVERAVITLEDGSGWRTVTPAAGLAGCRG